MVITPVQYPGQTETEPFARVFVLLDGFDVVLGYQPVIDLPVDDVRVGRRVSAVWASPAEETEGSLYGSLIGWMPNGEPDVDEEDKRLIKVIRSESARLADIVTDLLDYARPRKLERTKIEFGRALSELADSFRADYLDEVSAFREKYRRECFQSGIDYIGLDTSMRFDKALTEYLVSRRARC